LQPISGIGTPGTTAPFEVTVTSTTNLAITASDTENFVTPDVHGITLITDPAVKSASPGSSVPVELTITAAGNVAENVSLSATLPNGVTLNGLPTNVSLTRGETKRFPLTVNMGTGVALNQTLSVEITGDIAGTPDPSERSTVIQLSIRSAEVAAIEQTALKAATAEHTQLADVLSQLSDTLGQWEANPSDARLCERAQLQLDNIKAMLQATPSLAQFMPQLDVLRA
jgi:hypothetical protein